MSAPEQAVGGMETWSKPQHMIAYKEARVVMNAQQQRKNNLDTKALRTTALTTTIVGTLVTAVKAFGIGVAQPAGFLGGALLVVAFGLGIAAYSYRTPVLGPSANDLVRLVELSDEDWEQAFISQLGYWIEVNTERLDRNALLLLVSEVALFAGVLVTLSAMVV